MIAPFSRETGMRSIVSPTKLEFSANMIRAKADSHVRMEVLAMASDPPGEVRVAPGGGRVLTFGALFTPEAGENVHGVALVLLCQGPGAHPLSAEEPTRFAAERLAERGYTVLSVYSHMERGHSLFAFEETGYEIDAALDLLEGRGYEDFVLGGHGYGALAALYYVKAFPDVLLDQENRKRVRALALFAPLTELAAYPNVAFYGGYDAHMARAQASFDSGRGSIPPGHTIAVASVPGIDIDPWIATGPYVQPAELALNYWGAEAEARNARLLSAISTPTIILVGEDDATADIVKLRAAQAASSAPTEVILYPAGDASFTGLEDRAVEDLSTWLIDQGLGVRRRVATQPVDARSVSGRRLPGVLYRPEGEMAPGKPAFLMVHGRTGDILFSSTHWMSWRLAQMGYACLAVSTRISGAVGLQASATAEVAEDLGAWMNRFESLGFERVIPLGHSNGGVWISDYIAESHDPRVIGVVYIAPTAIYRSHAELMESAEYARQFEALQTAVKRGESRSLTVGYQTLNLWWDYNRPDTRNLHTERVTHFDLPALSIIGTADGLFEDGKFMAAFRAAYRGALDELEYEGGTHGLRENKHRIGPDVDAWVKKTFGS
jgi:pimeloyl-ACP methyl ester carboxylesterase